MGPGPLPLLLPLLLLLSAGLVPAQKKESQFEKFKRQHVDEKGGQPPDPGSYCTYMMKNRSMTVTFCKEINTFIHGALDDIVAVCNKNGTWIHQNYYYSNNDFPLTECNVTGGSHSPNCVYRGLNSTKQICVACDGGQPVHYAKASDCRKA